jgi:hypothetical protein
MKKIIYVLSGGGVVLKRTTAVPDHTPIGQHQTTSSAALSAPSQKSLKASPLARPPSHPLLASLAKLKSADELSNILTGVPNRGDELLSYLDNNLLIVKAISDSLTQRVELSPGEGHGDNVSESQSKIVLTAKIRRKVTRFAEALQEILSPKVAVTETVTTSATVTGTEEDEDEVEIKVVVVPSKKRKVNDTVDPGSVSSATEPTPVLETKPSVPSISYDDFIACVRQANSSRTIEEILKPFCSDWQTLLGIGCCRTRRALKRAIESHQTSGTHQDAHQTLEQALITLETITSAAIQAHLDSIQQSAEPSAPRTGTASGTNPPLPPPEVQKKKKQKVEPSPTPTPAAPISEGVSEMSDPTDASSATAAAAALSNISSHKHILFIGQLSFDTTTEDLLNYLKDTGVEGDISVRLLTDKDTKKSKGAAFVDFFGGKRSLKRIMDLHHTVLKGRRINVEHTSKATAAAAAALTTEQQAGGGDSKGGVMSSVSLKPQRIHQKIIESERIDSLLREYSHLKLGSKGGVIADDHLMNRLYAMTVGEVKEILEEYQDKTGVASSSSQGPGNLELLRRLIKKRDGGGSGVDQTRETREQYQAKRGLSREPRGSSRGTGVSDQEGEEARDGKRMKVDGGFGKFRAPGVGERGGESFRGGSGRGRGMTGRGGVSEVFRGRGGGGGR